MKSRKSPSTAHRSGFISRIANARADSGVAMLSAILFMIVMAGLGTIIVSTVLGQVKPTYADQKQTETVYAAQAGIQATLSLFRNAVLISSGVPQVDITTGATIGDPKKLPCSVMGDTNPVAGDGVQYTVSIRYYDVDPTFQTPTWQTTTSLATGDQLACSTTTGVASTTGHPVKYALLNSVGSAPAMPGSTNASVGNRSIGAVYQFQVSTVNIIGGRIFDYNDANAYCLSAVSAAPGSFVQFLPASQCAASTANDTLQLWSYYNDYEIKLASSTYNGAAGLCITGPPAAGSSNPQNVVLKTCISSPDASRWNQLWSWVGGNTWQGQTLTPAATAGPSAWALDTGYASGTNLTNKFLQVRNNGTVGGFSPTTQVGAGNAGFNTDEIVNYQEFGRCMDDTDVDVNKAFMISYPCKQDPTSGGANLEWNQKFYYGEPASTATTAGPQQINVTANSDATKTPLTDRADTYCLVTVDGAGNVTTTPANNALVKLTPCASKTVNLQWTRVYNTGDYGSSYKFTTYGGTLCLQVDPTRAYFGWSYLDVATCDPASLAQKWNAPAAFVQGDVGGYKEISG